MSDLAGSLLRTSDALGAWLLATSIQVAVLGGLVAIVDRLTERHVWPQLRAALWWLVILRLAAPPLLASPVSVWRWIDPAVQLQASIGPRGSEACADATPMTVGANLTARFASPGAGRIALAVWWVGAVLLSGVAIWRARSVRRAWLADPPEVPPAWFDDVVRQVAARLGLRRVPRIRVQPGAAGPAVIGVWRPVVVMPAGVLRQATRGQIEHVLLHEFAHIRRRDALASRLCLLVQIVFWFHPVAWLARVRLESLREICCDATVARVLRAAAPAYRETLLKMARSLLVQPAPLGFIHRHSQIMARLAYLQRLQPNRPAVVRVVSALTFGVLSVCCLPQPRQSHEPNQSAAVNLADLPGCLQLRYMVMRALAAEANANR